MSIVIFKITQEAIILSKKKSITIFVILAVIIVAAGVLSFIKFPMGLYDYNGYATSIKLGLDLSGGVSVTFDVATTEVVDGETVTIDRGDLEDRIQGAVTRLQDLLVDKGYSESVVSYDMSTDTPTIRVEVPDVDDPERIFTLISRPATLRFVNPDDYDEIYIEGKTDLETAYVSYDSDNAYYVVGLKFNDKGAKKFADVTEELSEDGTTTGYNTRQNPGGGRENKIVRGYARVLKTAVKQSENQKAETRVKKPYNQPFHRSKPQKS